jgi:hypothetical protein
MRRGSEVGDMYSPLFFFLGYLLSRQRCLRGVLQKRSGETTLTRKERISRYGKSHVVQTENRQVGGFLFVALMS